MKQNAPSGYEKFPQSPVKNDDGDESDFAQQDEENMMLIERNRAYFKKLIAIGDIDAVIQFIWAVFDSDESGYLDIDETEVFVKSVLSNILGTPFSKETYLQQFKEIDTDGSGVIDKAEMKVLMQKLIKTKMVKNLEEYKESGPIDYTPAAASVGSRKVNLNQSKTVKLAPLTNKPALPGRKSSVVPALIPLKIQSKNNTIDPEKEQDENTMECLIPSSEQFVEEDDTGPKIRRRDLNNYEYESSSEGEEDDGGGLVDLFDKNPFGGFMHAQEKSAQKTIPTNKIQRVSPEEQQMRNVEPPVYDVMKQGGNPNFDNYADLFNNLTTSHLVKTQYDIVSVIISYDSTKVVTCTKDHDMHYCVKQYDLRHNNQVSFEEHYKGRYIKMKDIEQNSDGNYYCCAYMDDGRFRLRHFGQDSDENVFEQDCQTKEESNVNTEGCYFDINMNPLLNMNDHTIPVAGFCDPYITACFIDDDRIFLNLFHNVELKQYMFIYSIKANNIISKVETYQFSIECSKKNFPYKTFYNYDDHQIYTFYRQGEGFSYLLNKGDFDTDKNDLSNYRVQKVYDNDLGQMFLYNNKALIARSSSKILFFKQVQDEITGKISWKLYYEISERGFVYFIKGNKRIQIATPEKIFFYLIDPEDYIPRLENCMNNFMQCSQMMFGSAVKYGVTFKTNQKDLSVYTRKFTHDFKVCVAQENLEGSMGINIKCMNCILVSNVDEIMMFDAKTWQEVKHRKIKVNLLPSTSRERNEIIAMNICPYEKLLGVITGKNLIKNAQKPNQLFIFKKSTTEGSDGEGIYEEFTQISQGPIRIADIKDLQGVCMDFVFKNNPISGKCDTIIFAQRDRILKFNFKRKTCMAVHVFKQPLNKQPVFFQMNDTQKICIIASADDSVYLNLYQKGDKKEIDIDEEFEISAIKSIIYDTGSFYILSNKARGKLGYFLVRMNAQKPIIAGRNGREELNGEFIINMGNKLDIADANMFVLKNEQHGYRELIVSYKTMYINTFNCMVIDLTDKLIIFRHESFQLWESQVRGFLTSKSHDFVILSREGICIIGLGSDDARKYKDQDQRDVMLHSLESTNYLKVEPNNHILIQDLNQEILIMIQEQVTDSQGETSYEDILKIRLNEITLRELLVLQSLYLCKTQSEIIELVKQQPNPSMFYKTFFELDKTNMLNIMAYDSKSMTVLLNEKFEELGFYQSEYPVFYMNKQVISKADENNVIQKKIKYRNALDIALQNNQMGAVNRIMWYITKYQNHFVSSFLFINNLPKIMEKGILIAELLESDVFNKNFDFDAWPATHTYNGKMIMPYNGSMFQLIDKYDITFGHELGKPKYNFNRKMYKIKYTLNILPLIGAHFNDKGVLIKQETKIMDLCFQGDELCVFDTVLIKDLIEFKWQQYAKAWHYFGAAMHFFYLFTIIIYIKQVYVENALGDYTQVFAIVLAVGLFYPAVYDISQLVREGREYFNDPWNYSDFVSIMSGIINIGQQFIMSPFSISARANMILVVFMLLMKTFFFLRIFESLSYIVTMIRSVIYDLRVFLSFYAIITVLFSLLIDILGIGNFNLPENFAKDNQPDDDGYFGQEYKEIGLFIGNIFQTLRMSMGDYDFDGANYLEPELNIIYWFCWVLIVAITCIIFLNFIIAEASASYETVMENLSEMIQKERASLIVESETMMPQRLKTKERFPQFIVIRQMDE